mmetsp:Transcript_22659/g.19673  ORF Transcript_22659/g.19673 Transcript_22659/m.19673 type:complete len:127 (+) Transcript_22659:29-409(+)
MSKSKNLSPVATLIDELKSDDSKKRLNSIKNFSTIAAAIGPERTRSELLPFVNELLDDEDDILLQLADSLGSLTDYLGGHQFSYLLLNPLEKICYMEDVAVRDKAAQNVRKVAKLMDFKKHEDLMA